MTRKQTQVLHPDIIGIFNHVVADEGVVDSIRERIADVFNNGATYEDFRNRCYTRIKKDLGVDLKLDFTEDQRYTLYDALWDNINHGLDPLTANTTTDTAADTAAGDAPEIPQGFGVFAIELGKLHKDRVTGFIGAATAVCFYLHGNTQVCLEGLVNGEPKQVWFAESRVSGV